MGDLGNAYFCCISGSEHIREIKVGLLAFDSFLGPMGKEGGVQHFSATKGLFVSM